MSELADYASQVELKARELEELSQLVDKSRNDMEVLLATDLTGAGELLRRIEAKAGDNASRFPQIVTWRDQLISRESVLTELQKIELRIRELAQAQTNAQIAYLEGQRRLVGDFRELGDVLRRLQLHQAFLEGAALYQAGPRFYDKAAQLLQQVVEQVGDDTPTAAQYLNEIELAGRTEVMEEPTPSPARRVERSTILLVAAGLILGVLANVLATLLQSSWLFVIGLLAIGVTAVYYLVRVMHSEAE